jgi:hypothetical protein
MKSALKWGLLSVILTVMTQGQVWSAQEKQARSDRPARARQAAQNQATAQGGGQINRLLNQVKALGLTPDQTKAVQELVQKAGAKMKASQEAVTAARKGLDEAVFEGADAQTIRPAAQKFAQAMTDQAVFQASVVNAIRKQLTAEQLSSLQKKNRAQRVAGTPKPKAQKARDPEKAGTRAKNSKKNAN